jgi:endonuclease/exonuclease/phosphatase (EEP) superfamily protein YafD
MKFRWLLLGLVVVVLIVPALVLTFARLVQPDSGLWVRLVSFAPYAVVLYVVVFLFLVVAVIRGRGGWRSAAVVFLLVALGGAVLHGWWLSPLWFDTESGPDRLDQPEASTGSVAGDTTVMSVNLMVGQASAARIVDIAARNDVDILVLQEVTPAALDRLRIAGLDQAYLHSAGAAMPGVAGTMVFAEEPLTDITPLDTTIGGWAMTIGGDSTLLAIHPWPPFGDASEWHADHAAVRRAVGERTGPALVVGDFNATLDHRVVQELLARDFRDAAAGANSGWQPTWPAGGEVTVTGVPIPPMMALDHVLVRGPLHAVDTQTVTIAGTDHRALIAELRR